MISPQWKLQRYALAGAAQLGSTVKSSHRLNLELNLQSLFGLLCTLYSCTHWLRPRNTPTPRIWTHIQGRYWSAKIDDISL
jgi:hypothetical protein